MTRLGMDVDAVEQAGRDLRSRAESIESLKGLVDRLVNNLPSVWDGADAQQFVDQWWPQHRTNLAAAITAIAGLGQAALNNASEQRSVSSGNGAGSAVGPAPSTPAPDGSIGQSNAGGGAREVLPQGRSVDEMRAGYERWAKNRFAPGGESYLQCTAWANYRWHELGYDGIVDGHGGAMAGNAPGELSSQPSLHAMASYGAGVNGAEGHVMIVEEVFPDGRIRVSEMNVPNRNSDVQVWGKFRDHHVFTPVNGVYKSWTGETIRFAPFPGGS